jgi:hypothetical protein
LFKYSESFIHNQAKINLLEVNLKVFIYNLYVFKISYWRRTDPESTAKQVTKREQSVILVDLDIYTEYAISVQAINLAGEGPKSVVKYEKTLEGCKSVC